MITGILFALFLYSAGRDKSNFKFENIISNIIQAMENSNEENNLASACLCDKVDLVQKNIEAHMKIIETKENSKKILSESNSGKNDTRQNLKD